MSTAAATAGKQDTRRPHLDRYYDHRIAAFAPGDFDYRAVLTRTGVHGRDRTIPLDRGLTTITWADSSAVLTGSVSVQRPRPDADYWRIGEADMVRLLVSRGGDFKRLWTMRVNADPDVDLQLGSTPVDLADDLVALSKTQRDWSYRKTKDHPKAWSSHEVTIDVCRRCRIEPKRIAKGVAELPDIKLQDGSGLEVIRRAYAEDKKKSGIRYVIRLADGGLEVIPLGRPKIVYLLHGLPVAASTSQKRKQRPFTVINAVGHTRSQDGSDKLTMTVTRDAARRRFGHIEVHRDYGRVSGRDDLRQQAERDLAAELRQSRTAQLSIPCIPYLRRGDVVRWITDEPGWSGQGEGTLDRSYAYVTDVQHTVNPGDAFSDLTIIQADPYLADQRRLDDEARKKKHKGDKGNG